MRVGLITGCLVCFILFKTQAQITISGIVTDIESNEVLIGAYITEPYGNKGTTTNNYGFFSHRVNDTVDSLIVSFVGYKKEFIKVPFKDTLIEIQLSVDNKIDEIVVRREKEFQSSVERLTSATVKSLPVILGESDITRTVQLLPGVVAGTETTSGYFVRGGNSDQNLILIDGVPIYNSYHLMGMFSVFNSDAINDMKFYKGTLPVNYGGRLSSVMDISLREGNSKKYSGELMLGTFTSKFLIEGSIVKNKTSFLITGRRSVLDISPERFRNIIVSLSGMNVAKGDAQHIDLYEFYDINAKINHKFSSKNSLYFSFYNGKDNYDPYDYPYYQGIENTNTFNFGNQTLSLRYNHALTSNLFANILAYNTKYEYENSRDNYPQDESGNKQFGSTFKNESGINDYSIQFNFEHSLTNHQLKYGLQYVNHTFTPSITTYRNQNINIEYNIDTSFNYKYIINDMSAYISDKFYL